ncbi:hypothetical protein ACFSM7_07945 [Clavibacter michiganensis subsp. tessellarius]
MAAASASAAGRARPDPRAHGPDPPSGGRAPRPGPRGWPHDAPR